MPQDAVSVFENAIADAKINLDGLRRTKKITIKEAREFEANINGAFRLLQSIQETGLQQGHIAQLNEIQRDCESSFMLSNESSVKNLMRPLAEAVGFYLRDASSEQKTASAEYFTSFGGSHSRSIGPSALSALASLPVSTIQPAQNASATLPAYPPESNAAQLRLAQPIGALDECIKELLKAYSDKELLPGRTVKEEIDVIDDNIEFLKRQDLSMEDKCIAYKNLVDSHSILDKHINRLVNTSKKDIKQAQVGVRDALATVISTYENTVELNSYNVSQSIQALTADYTLCGIKKPEGIVERALVKIQEGMNSLKNQGLSPSDKAALFKELNVVKQTLDVYISRPFPNSRVLIAADQKNLSRALGGLISAYATENNLSKDNVNLSARSNSLKKR